MQPTTDLTKLHLSLRKRLTRVEIIAGKARSVVGYDRRIFISHCVIELDNLIVGGIREFLGSSLTRARTIKGSRVATSRSFGSQDEIGAYILSVLNTQSYLRKGSPRTIPRRDEPTIRNPRQVDQVLRSVNATNLDSVANALALNFTVFDEISSVRNFYAHRNAHTFERVRNKARGWGIVQLDHVDEIGIRAKPRRPVPILDEWIFEVRDFMVELMQ